MTSNHVASLVRDARARDRWLVGLATLLAGYLPGAAVVHMTDDWLRSGDVAHVALRVAEALIGAVGVLWGFWWFRRTGVPRRSHRLMRTPTPWLAIAASVGLHVSGHSVSQLLTADVPMLELPGRLSVAGAAAILFVVTSLFLAAELRSQAPAARTRRLGKGDPVPRGHLVTFLSALHADHFSSSRGWPEWLTDDGGGRNLDDDLRLLRQHKVQPGGRMWSWEPLLAGLHPHLQAGVLESVTVVVSHQSAHQLPWLAEVWGRYPALAAVSLRVLSRAEGDGWRSRPAASALDADPRNGVAFEDFDALWCALEGAIHSLEDEYGARDADITIDFTGGQKPASVAAAVISFNSLVQGQYVQTGEPWEVLAYDLVADQDAPSA